MIHRYTRKFTKRKWVALYDDEYHYIERGPVYHPNFTAKMVLYIYRLSYDLILPLDEHVNYIIPDSTTSTILVPRPNTLNTEDGTETNMETTIGDDGVSESSVVSRNEDNNVTQDKHGDNDDDIDRQETTGSIDSSLPWSRRGIVYKLTNM